MFMSALRASIIAIVLPVVHAQPSASACDRDASFDTILSAVGGLSRPDADLLAQGCLGNGVDEEQCLCGALRLGFVNATAAALRARMLRKEPVPALRRLAQDLHAGAIGVLARLHPKYPYHLKVSPALDWAQSETTVLVRIRYSRYARGEPLVLSTESLKLEWDDESLYLAAEGNEKAIYFETSLPWAARLLRRDDCADSEGQCVKWAQEGACDLPPDPSDAPSLRERCARSCGACPAANGSLAVHASYAAVPGGLVFEARKATAEPWERPLSVRFPMNRVATSELKPGALLDCDDACREHWWSGCKAKDDGDESPAACAERCRKQCEDELGASFTVR